MMESIAELIEQIPRIRILDIGAMPIHGESPSYDPLISLGNVQLVGIDPYEWVRGELQTIYKGRCEHDFFTAVIGDGGPKRFNVCAMQSRSSVFQPNCQHSRQFIGFEKPQEIIKTIEVESDTLDSLFPHEVFDFIKVDIQGSELECIQYGNRVISAATVLEIEVEFLEQYSNQPLFADIDILLRRLGFIFHSFMGFGTAPRKTGIFAFDQTPRNTHCKQWIWSDAVYVKPPEDLKENHDLLVAAVTLHECYQSYDLACAYLSKYDSQSGTRFAELYRENIARK